MIGYFQMKQVCLKLNQRYIPYNYTYFPRKSQLLQYHLSQLKFDLLVDTDR